MAEVIYGTQGTNVRAVLTYTTSSTNTSVTISATAALQRYQNYGAPYRIYVSVGSNSKSSIGVNENTYSNWTTVHSATTSGTYTRTKSAQTIKVASNFVGEAYDGWVAGPYEGSTSVNVTVPALPSYKVTYNANGGSGAPTDEDTKWYGETLKLQSGRPTRTGYTFLGWSTSSSATSASYQPGGNYTANSGATLYAVWSENYLTVNYRGNGATYATWQGNPVSTDKPTTGTFYYDNNYTDGLNNVQNTSYLYLERDGYKPTGYWGTTTTGGTLLSQSTAYTGQSLAQAVGKTLASGNASVDLYAQWQANTTTLSYDANGGTGAPAAHTNITIGSTITLSTTIPTLEKHKFKGWYNGQYTYQPGESYYVSGPITLVAQWERIYNGAVYTNGSYKKGDIYLRKNGSFVYATARVYVRQNGQWVEQ